MFTIPNNGFWVSQGVVLVRILIVIFNFFLQARSQEEGESSQRRTEDNGEEMNDRRRRRDKNDGEREIEKEEKQKTAKGEVDHESQR